jgi:hypothetical protein
MSSFLVTPKSRYYISSLIFIRQKFMEMFSYEMKHLFIFIKKSAKATKEKKTTRKLDRI